MKNVNCVTGSGRAAVGVMRAVISSAPESPCTRASHTKERAPMATLMMKTAAFLISKSYQKWKTKRQKFPVSYPGVRRQMARPELRLCLSALGSALEHLGELFNLFSFLDHADGEHVGGRRFLYFFVQFAGELVKPLNPFAEFLFVLLQHRSFCRGGGLRVRVNL